MFLCKRMHVFILALHLLFKTNVMSSSSKNKKGVNISSVTGRYVTAAYAKKYPRTTVQMHVAKGKKSR